MSYSTPIYTEPGGVKTVIGSGGTLDASGGTIALPESSLKMLVAAGRNGTGNITLTGAATGDKVVGVVSIAGTPGTVSAGTFATSAVATNTIGQVSASNLTANTYLFVLSTPTV